VNYRELILKEVESMNPLRRLIIPCLVAVTLLTSACARQIPRSELAVPIIEFGNIGDAPFRIDIPEDWNGGLVMYAHGYSIVGSSRGYNRLIPQAVGSLGFAVAQSRYSKQGWAAEQGVLETEELRRYFIRKYGATSPTVIAGHSQGAAITFATITRYSDAYDGALPMCGTSQPTIQFMREQIFDMRLFFDYYFPGLEGSAIEPEGHLADMAGIIEKVKELTAADPERAEWFSDYFKLPGVEAIPRVIAFWTVLLAELHERTGGNPFGNEQLVYGGTEDDAKFNAEIPRAEADRESEQYLIDWVTISGEIEDPVVTMHTLVDQLIPVEVTAYYDTLTKVEGTNDLLVQLYVDRIGHCAFSLDETVEALRRLVDWIETGDRPEGGDVTIKIDNEEQE